MLAGILVMGVLALALVYIIYANSKKPRDFMSFKESLDLAELPIVTFKQGNKKLNFILDTGSNNSVINKATEEALESETIDTNGTIFGLDGILSDTPIKRISFNYKNKKFEEDFQVVDMSKTIRIIKKTKGVTIHGLIGNGFMQKYKYVLDFKEMIAYSKK